MTSTRPRTEPERGPAAAGPTRGTPYTVYFPEGDPIDSADLELPAPLPRVGDKVEFIDERLACHRYVVREVIHTLQVAPTDQRANEPALRPGLPKVFLGPETQAAQPATPEAEPGQGGAARR
jgi:hypothetical protein